MVRYQEEEGSSERGDGIRGGEGPRGRPRLEEEGGVYVAKLVIQRVHGRHGHAGEGDVGGEVLRGQGHRLGLQREREDKLDDENRKSGPGREQGQKFE